MSPYELAQQIVKDGVTTPVQLVYVDPSDHLLSGQVDYLLAGDYDSLYDDIGEWYSDSVEAGMSMIMKKLDDTIDDLSETHNLNQKRVRQYVEDILLDMDTSDPITTLANQTSPTLLRYRLLASDLYGFLEQNGFDMTDGANVSALKSLYNNTTPDDGLHTFYVLAYMLPAQAIPNNTTAILNPYIVALDSYNGKGWDAQFTGTLTLHVTENARWIRDEAYSYSWTQVAGPTKFAYFPEGLAVTRG